MNTALVSGLGSGEYDNQACKIVIQHH